jgi:hypothetical protein
MLRVLIARCRTSTLVIITTSSGAQAQGLVTTQKLSAALANELVGESVAECKKNSHAVVVIIVDLDSVRQAVLRGDGAPIHSTDNASTKLTLQPLLLLPERKTAPKPSPSGLAKLLVLTVPQFALPSITTPSAAASRWVM